MDAARLPEIIREMYRLVAELKEMFPGRHFTPDGHTVGSIGETLASHHYGVALLKASTKGRDAMIDLPSRGIGNSKTVFVEIKATQGDSVALRHEPEHLLVLKLDENGGWSEVYNGPGNIVWDTVKHKELPDNGQFQVRCNTLRRLMEKVPAGQQLQRVA